MSQYFNLKVIPNKDHCDKPNNVSLNYFSRDNISNIHRKYIRNCFFLLNFNEFTSAILSCFLKQIFLCKNYIEKAFLLNEFVNV
jgi:hypothetical protein